MKYLNKILALALVVFVSHSCSDLEEDVSSLLTLDRLQSEGDIVASLAPIYREVLETQKIPHWLRITTYGSDDITTWEAGNKFPFRVFDRFEYGNGENSEIDNLNHPWDGFWRTIYFSNSLINGLDLSEAPEDAVALGLAEARTFRAFSYLNLVKIFGNVPLILDGVVPTGDEVRATVLENYQQIESDLLFAESILPLPGSEEAGRISASFAKAVLADLYLTWAGWPVKDASKNALAAATAKEIIDFNYHELLPIEELWLQEGADSREAIFSIRHSTDLTTLGNAGTAFTHHQGRGFSDLFPEFAFFNNFPEGPRKDATFVIDIPNRGVTNGVLTDRDPVTTPWPESDRGHPMYNKYVLSVDLTFTNRPVTSRSIELYRYAEILLIYAEAEARASGGNASSIEALNQVKRRAAGLPFLSSDATVDVAFATANEIVDEKGWELAAENKRWFDLVRTERVAEAALARDPSEPVDLFRMPTEAQFIAPIPLNSIVLSVLEQNPSGFRIQ